MNFFKPTNYYVIITLLIFAITATRGYSQEKNPRAYGIEIGVMDTGPMNGITDVEGVMVGQETLWEGDSIRTGVTAVLPHEGNVFRNKAPAGVYVSNGFGKMMGTTQIRELGNLETPIVLTNTLSVPTAAEALITYTIEQDENQNVRSVNPVVGETNDGWLNEIRARHVDEKHVIRAIEKADSARMEQGVVGAGTGTTAFGFKGGIGTSSRKIPDKLGGYTVGILVQTNFGGILSIDGVPIGEELDQYYLDSFYGDQPEGSCMIVVATDAPLSSRNLERLAKRATFGLSRTGGFGSNGSGDYAIAFSTAPEVRIEYQSQYSTVEKTVLRNAETSPLFQAAVEATEEAIINSLFASTDTQGRNGHTANALPVNKVMDIMRSYGHKIEKP